MQLLRHPDFRYPALLTLVALLLWAPRLRGPIDLRLDAGVYYILGTSLAQGDGYRLLNEPGDIQAIQYPPALPTLVAIHQKVLGTSNPGIVGKWLRRTYCLMFLMYSLSAYLLARQLLSSGYAFFVALICTLNTDILYLSDYLYAEIPFALATSLFFVCSRKAFSGSPALEGEGVKTRTRPIWFVISALLGITAYFLRTAGIAILGAWVLEAILKRQWKQVALRGAVALVPIIAWQGWIAHVHSGDSYSHPTYAYQRAPYQFYNVSYAENIKLVDPFKPDLGSVTNVTLLKRALVNSTGIPAAVGEAVSMPEGIYHWAIGGATEKAGRDMQHPLIPWKTAAVILRILGWITILGAVILAIKREWMVVAYICAYSALICLTPWPEQFGRYLSPLAPFLVLCLVQPLAMLRETLAKRSIKFGGAPLAFVAGAIVLMTAGADVVVFSIRHSRGPDFASPAGPIGSKYLYYKPAWKSWDRALDWINSNTKKTDVVATIAPHLMYIRTDRKAVLPPMEIDTTKELKLLDSVPVRFLVVSGFDFVNTDYRCVDPMIKANPAAWKIVFTAPDGLTRIYERASQ